MKIEVEDVAELLELVIRFPRNCEQYGIEAIARKYKASAGAIDLAEELSTWKRRERAQEEVA